MPRQPLPGTARVNSHRGSPRPRRRDTRLDDEQRPARSGRGASAGADHPAVLMTLAGRLRVRAARSLACSAGPSSRRLRPASPYRAAPRSNPDLPVVGEAVWTSGEGLGLTVRIAVHAVRRIPGATVLDWSVTPLSGAGLNSGDAVPAVVQPRVVPVRRRHGQHLPARRPPQTGPPPADPDRPGPAGMSVHTRHGSRSVGASRGRNQPCSRWPIHPCRAICAVGRRRHGDRAHLQPASR